MVRVNGVSPPMAILSFNNNIDTLERAVKERVFFVKEGNQFVSPPKPLPGHFSVVLSDTLKQLELYLPRTAPLSRQEFVNSFRGRKLQVYTAAYEDLLRKGFTHMDARVKVFVKYEKTDFTRKSDPVPRVISPRSPRYNIEVGRFLRPLEERIFNSLAKLFRHPTVIKGMNARQSGKTLFQKWSVFKDPVAVGLDASRFDQHVSKEALEWEHGVYKKCFPRRRHQEMLGSLLKYQVNNRCAGYTADGKLSYTVEGVRMSGDMNTSLGNCILMCCMIHAYALTLGVVVHLANNGDDCVVFMERRVLGGFLTGLHRFFRDLGFTMVAEEPCFVFEEIEFCQTKPVWVGPNHDDYLMVRHPKWAIAKDTVSVHNYHTPKMFKGWLHSVGEGGMAMAGRVPIFQEFYALYLRYGKAWGGIENVQSWGVRTLSRGMERRYGDISPATRASFYWAFGVTPDEQLVLEDFYRGVELVTDVGKDVCYQPLMPL